MRGKEANVSVRILSANFVLKAAFILTPRLLKWPIMFKVSYHAPQFSVSHQEYVNHGAITRPKVFKTKIDRLFLKLKDFAPANSYRPSSLPAQKDTEVRSSFKTWGPQPKMDTPWADLAKKRTVKGSKFIRFLKNKQKLLKALLSLWKFSTQTMETSHWATIQQISSTVQQMLAGAPSSQSKWAGLTGQNSKPTRNTR